jgi:hypothetical protein
MKTLTPTARVAQLLAVYDAPTTRALSPQEGTQRLIGDVEALIRWAPHQWHVPAQKHQLPWNA